MDYSAIRMNIAPPPQGDIHAYLPIFGLCVALLLLGLAVYMRSRGKLVLKTVALWFIISALITAIIYWFRYEGVLYFDSNIWLFVALAVFVGYGFRYGYIRVKQYPQEQLKVQQQSIKEKYLPKKKNR